MSQENVEVVRRGFEAYERGDIPAMLADFDPDAITYRATEPDAAIYHGPEGFLQSFVDWIEDFDDFTMSVDEFIDANASQVIVHLHQRATGSSSGAPVEIEGWFVFTLGGGKVVRLDMHVGKEAALEAVGRLE
jgi:ketosteroid isomerase-like protein